MVPFRSSRPGPAVAPAEGPGVVAPAPPPVQEALWVLPDDGGRGRGADQPLSEVTFVVVDLETTGGAPADAGITEVGAVKVRGGEVLGEFQTLVHPGTAIPPFISVLTGISDSMVASAPGLPAVLPAFLEFARGAVLVAHNAPYDVGFLRAACAKTGHEWPRPAVVDTVALARHLVGPDEVPDRKLATLARRFGSATTPNHRALTDAQATVDVLHALIGRLGPLGVTTLGELRAFTSRVPESSRRKRHLADGLPNGPGVYVFHDEKGQVLYVGTSVDIRTRVRTYFTASEQLGQTRQARCGGNEQERHCNVGEILNQITMMLGHEIFDPETSRRVLVDHAFIVAGGKSPRQQGTGLAND